MQNGARSILYKEGSMNGVFYHMCEVVTLDIFESADLTFLLLFVLQC